MTANGQIRFKNWREFMFKQFVSSVAAGVLAGIIVALVIRALG
jgi:Mg/Co/Ni transporter MgtE